MAAIANLTIDQGATFSSDVTVKDANNNAFDLTGYTAQARMAKGYEMLVTNAYNGINGMPAKGLCADCTKEEIGVAVQYMLDSI